MPTASDAHRFAADAHSGRLDQDGKPHIRHINRVAAAADARARHARLTDGLKINLAAILQAAYLHDVLEDTETTVIALRRTGFAETVIAMVELLTSNDEVMSHAERISELIRSGNLGVILIRLSDNEDNAHTAGGRYAVNALRHLVATAKGCGCSPGVHGASKLFCLRGCSWRGDWTLRH